MAITNNCAKFIFFAKKNGVSFNHTLTLGRLNLYATKKEIQKNIDKFQNNTLGLEDVTFVDDYAEPFFRILGAEAVDSMDYSDYEHATIVHDLNNPIPEKLKNKFDVVVDGGTIEHVFNFPVAIKNCMQALKKGGHYIGITTANNYMGHGFYQFSPELYYRIFDKENGFVVKHMLICAQVENHDSRWFSVEDPKKVGERVMLLNSLPVTLMVIAQKMSDVDIFKITPQQSDYASTWASNDSLKRGQRPEGVGITKHTYRRLVPNRLRVFFRKVYDLFSTNSVQTDELGDINPLHYKEVEI